LPPLALEPRYTFDGAAVVTAEQAIPEALMSNNSTV
jgi:hypothetical protein